MSRTFGQWFRFTVVCVAVGFLISTMYASLGVTRSEVGSEVRRPVDFTVLPIVMPDGSEAPAQKVMGSDAIEGESSLPPEQAPTTQTAATPTPEAPELTAEPEPEPASAPAPTPTPEVPKFTPAPDPDEAASRPGVISSIKLIESSDSFTISLKGNKTIYKKGYLNLNNPRRLVVDLLGKWKLTTKNVLRSKGTVKHIVVGEHPDKLRLVVHFNTPPKGELSPKFKLSKNAITVTVPLP